jgi:hypothetical protein
MCLHVRRGCFPHAVFLTQMSQITQKKPLLSPHTEEQSLKSFSHHLRHLHDLYHLHRPRYLCNLRHLYCLHYPHHLRYPCHLRNLWYGFT